MTTETPSYWTGEHEIVETVEDDGPCLVCGEYDSHEPGCAADDSHLCPQTFQPDGNGRCMRTTEQHDRRPGAHFTTLDQPVELADWSGRTWTLPAGTYVRWTLDGNGVPSIISTYEPGADSDENLTAL